MLSLLITLPLMFISIGCIGVLIIDERPSIIWLIISVITLGLSAIITLLN